MIEELEKVGLDQRIINIVYPNKKILNWSRGRY